MLKDLYFSDWTEKDNIFECSCSLREYLTPFLKIKIYTDVQIMDTNSHYLNLDRKQMIVICDYHSDKIIYSELVSTELEETTKSVIRKTFNLLLSK